MCVRLFCLRLRRLPGRVCVCVCAVFVVSLCRVACDLVFACFCLCSVYMDESRLLLVDIAGCLSTFAICFMFDCDMFDLAVFVCFVFLFFCFLFLFFFVFF